MFKSCGKSEFKVPTSMFGARWSSRFGRNRRHGRPCRWWAPTRTRLAIVEVHSYPEQEARWHEQSESTKADSTIRIPLAARIHILSKNRMVWSLGRLISFAATSMSSYRRVEGSTESGLRGFLSLGWISLWTCGPRPSVQTEFGDTMYHASRARV